MRLVPRGEYPRPHFDRSHTWRSLNGTWDFAPDPDEDGKSRGLHEDLSPWPSSIVVPFAWETPASGVNRHWMPCGWYRRSLQVPQAWFNQRIILHFGAVHHAATVWVDGREVGRHEGGYTPFEFDITDALTDRVATLVVRVDAPVDKRDIVHGKQRSIPRDDYDGCSFTPSSGIWQSVWLEARPATYIRKVLLWPTDALDGFLATIEFDGPNIAGSTLQLEVSGEPPIELSVTQAAHRVMLPISQPRLWRPEDPYVYDVTAVLRSTDGGDTVGTFSGLRKVDVDNGHILLNGERLYVRGVLDQGYWPGTGITAPDDDAFITDIQLARAAGFNLVRKHLKLEDPRFLYHADRLGMLVWAEPASTGRFTPDAMRRFEAQIEPMASRDGNHPSIVIWGLYNEEWGLDWDVPGDPEKQDAVRRAFRVLKGLDSSRPVVDNSGWTHVETDLVDWHIYDERPDGWSKKVAALLSGSTDRFPVSIAVDQIVQKSLMAAGGKPPSDLPNLNSEYGGGYTSVERGWNMRWQTQELRRYDNLSGYVWTELYDIEHETAGIYSFERTTKDSGGNDPASINAETVLIIDVEAGSPGRDVVVTERTLEFGVRISHHGPGACELAIAAVWGPILGNLATVDRADATAHGVVEVKPFMVTEPHHISTTMPDGTRAGRLHLLALRNDEVVATSCIDIALNE